MVVVARYISFYSFLVGSYFGRGGDNKQTRYWILVAQDEVEVVQV